MALFRGQHFDQVDANHIFVCNHPGFIHAGLASFNLQTLSSFSKNRVLCENMLKSFRKFDLPTDKVVERPAPPPEPNPEGTTTTLPPTKSVERIEFFGLEPKAFLKELIATLFVYDIDQEQAERDNTEVTSENTALNYDKWSNSSRTYVSSTITVDTLYDTIIWYEEYCADPASKDDSEVLSNLEGTVFDIQRSHKGYATRVKDLNSRFAVGSTSFDFHFIEKGKLKRSRTIVQKGVPSFASTPRTKTGRHISHKRTSDANPGFYVQAEDNPQEDNPLDQVVGPMRVSWDSNTQMYECNNQTIAILLEDLQPAYVPPIDVSTDNVDSFIDNENKTAEYYDIGSDSYMGNFTTALAIPVGLENGNPHMFGPNIIDCDEASVEKIRLVNRANRTYVRGERVVANYIDGEWIPTPIGEDQVELQPPATAIGRWQFSQFIASTSVHFRPNSSFFSVGTASSDGTGVLDGQNYIIKPGDWEQIFRWKFYNKYEKGKYNNHTAFLDLEKFSLEHAVKPDLIRQFGEGLGFNTLHIQHSSFDNLPKDDYGTDHNRYYMTNHIANPLTGEHPHHYDFPLFFGAVFTNGFRKSTSIKPGFKYSPKVGSIPSTYKGYYADANHFQRFARFINGEHLTFGFDFVVPVGESPTFSILAAFHKDINKAGKDNYYIAESLLHVPAEIGINGSWSTGLSAPLESFHTIARGMNRLDFGSGGFYDTKNYEAFRLYTDGTPPYKWVNGVVTGKVLSLMTEADFNNGVEDLANEIGEDMTAGEALAEYSSDFDHWKQHHTQNNTLIPNSTSEVQFTSLSPTFAGMDERIAQDLFVISDRQFYTYAQNTKAKFPDIGTSLRDALYRCMPQVGGRNGEGQDRGGEGVVYDFANKPPEIGGPVGDSRLERFTFTLGGAYLTEDQVRAKAGDDEVEEEEEETTTTTTPPPTDDSDDDDDGLDDALDENVFD